MLGPVEVTILMDDISTNASLSAEHGFSAWVQTPELSGLFDTGPSSFLGASADQLGVDISRAGFIALSHGHHDHTGGLSEAIRRAPGAIIYAHPDVLSARYRRLEAPLPKSIGISELSAGALSSRAAQVVWTRKPVRLSEQICLTGPMPAAIEHPSAIYFLDPACTRPDCFMDEQALWIRTLQGVVVITGCAHIGGLEILKYVKSLAAPEQVIGLLGGLHLKDTKEEKLEAAVKAFNRMGLRWIAPCHCTGIDAGNYLKKHFKGDFIPCSLGSRLHL